MIKAILFDLDDTLLGNPTGRFMNRYFALLGDHSSDIQEPEKFLRCVIGATQETIASTDSTMTNADVFWDTFTALSGLERPELEPSLAQFYDEVFPQLQSETTRRPQAADLLDSARDNGLQIVIATNPLFPRTAIEQRLDWAGVPIDQYDYALVTTYENMHASKPNPGYYQEILDRVNVAPCEALMVGNDWGNDIVPANQIGINTYWISDNEQPQDPGMIAGNGRLSDLQQLIDTGWLATL